MAEKKYNVIKLWRHADALKDAEADLLLPKTYSSEALGDPVFVPGRSSVAFFIGDSRQAGGPGIDSPGRLGA